MKPCTFCQAPTPDYSNYCNWECMVAESMRDGCPVICPNGLPPHCRRGYDGALMEHEHADHAGYKYPVEVKYIGPEGPYELTTEEGTKPMTPEEIEQERLFDLEEHALLFAGGNIVLTAYECCYHLFYLDTGVMTYGLGGAGKWKLTDESLRKIRETR